MKTITFASAIAIAAVFLEVTPGFCEDNSVYIHNIEVTQTESVFYGSNTFGYSYFDIHDFYTGHEGAAFSEKWRLIDDWDNPVWFDGSWWDYDDTSYRPDSSDYYIMHFRYGVAWDLVDFTTDTGDPWHFSQGSDFLISWDGDAPSRMMLSTFSNFLTLAPYDFTTTIEFDYEANITDNNVKLGVVSHDYDGNGLASHAVFAPGQHSGYARSLSE